MATGTFENLRTIKISNTFDGTATNGANGGIIDLGVAPELDENEFIFDFLYKVDTTLTSGDTAGTYLTAGITVDDTDALLTSSTGIVDTLNSGAAGTKPTIAYSIATTNGRDIVLQVGGTNDITGGTLSLFIVVARMDETLTVTSSDLITA